MSFSAGARAMVEDSVDYFGESSTIAATDGTSTATPKAMVVSFSRDLVNGSEIEVNDLQVIIPESEISFIPTNVKINGKGYRIINPGLVRPGDNTIFMRLHAREV